MQSQLEQDIEKAIDKEYKIARQESKKTEQTNVLDAQRYYDFSKSKEYLSTFLSEEPSQATLIYYGKLCVTAESAVLKQFDQIAKLKRPTRETLVDIQRMQEIVKNIIWKILDDQVELANNPLNEQSTSNTSPTITFPPTNSSRPPSDWDYYCTSHLAFLTAKEKYTNSSSEHKHLMDPWVEYMQNKIDAMPSTEYEQKTKDLIVYTRILDCFCNPNHLTRTLNQGQELMRTQRYQKIGVGLLILSASLLIAASIALAVVTAGAATPFSIAGIALGYSMIASAIGAVGGASFIFGAGKAFYMFSQHEKEKDTFVDSLQPKNT